MKSFEVRCNSPFQKAIRALSCTPPDDISLDEQLAKACISLERGISLWIHRIVITNGDRMVPHSCRAQGLGESLERILERWDDTVRAGYDSSPHDRRETWGSLLVTINDIRELMNYVSAADMTREQSKHRKVSACLHRSIDLAESTFGEDSSVFRRLDRLQQEW